MNTVPFSTTEIDDKQLHHIPHNELSKLQRYSGIDYNIAIMHHSTEWFCADTQRVIENKLFENCELVFQGHEHNETNTNVENALSQRIKIIRNGEFSLVGSVAEFNAVVLDTESSRITVHRFVWDNNERIFKVEGTPKTDTLSLKHSQLFPSKEFLDGFLKGGHKLTDSDCLLDYFVFPKLVARENEPRSRTSVTTSSDFFAELENVACICIEGETRTGKTTVMKSLFLEAANREFVPLFLENKPSLDSRIDKLVKHLVEDQYGEENAQYERFKQTARAK
jgi:hypothetical protein